MAEKASKNRPVLSCLRRDVSLKMSPPPSPFPKRHLCSRLYLPLLAVTAYGSVSLPYFLAKGRNGFLLRNNGKHYLAKIMMQNRNKNKAQRCGSEASYVPLHAFLHLQTAVSRRNDFSRNKSCDTDFSSHRDPGNFPKGLGFPRVTPYMPRGD